MRKGSTFYWLLSDHLGSTSKVAAAAGALHSQQLYKAWGESRYTSGTLPTRYTYTGQYSYANDFGLVFYGSRFYDPLLSRWTQPDTIIPSQTDPLSWDRFAYTCNNPVKYNDPSGHCPWCIGGLVLGGIAGAVIYASTSLASGREMSAGGFLTSVGMGAVGGALLGTGIGVSQWNSVVCSYRGWKRGSC